MLLELSQLDLQKLVVKQIDNFLLISELEKVRLSEALPEALARSEYCFSFSTNKYYQKCGETYFSPFHSGQYAIFLYFLSNSIFQRNPDDFQLAGKVYYLNKILNSVELFYEVQLPKVFFADHPIGSVMGRASYGDRFSFAQNCTVGNNHGRYPTIGENVTMAAGATVLGGSRIGSNVVLSVGAYVKDTDIPDNSIVFGTYPNLLIKQRDESYFQGLNTRPIN